MNNINNTPSKPTAIRVTIVSFFAVIAAIMLFIASIQKKEYLYSVLSVIIAVSLFDYVRYVWNEYKKRNSENSSVKT